MRPYLATAALLFALAGCSDAGGQSGGGIALEPVVRGLEQPVHLTAPRGDARLFVVEQPGRIRIVSDGAVRDTPFLDLTDRVRAGGERGLLSLAFHPRYAENGFFYVNYTGTRGETRIERHRVSEDPDLADPSSATLVLSIDQPYGNHNGGHILFGPDGLLYIGMGDGGAANDPHGHGQNPRTLLGAILRIDIDAATPYAIPAGNPFAAGGGRPEIWATGVRNPWRMWIDGETHTLYFGDVGQNRYEEIDAAPLDQAGLDYGWNVMEGLHCFQNARCDTAGLTPPVLEYAHDDGCSVTGGLVYRGARAPAIAGHYLYADYCSGWIRGFRLENGVAVDRRTWIDRSVGPVSSFGEDGAREAYVLTLDGDVFRIVAAP